LRMSGRREDRGGHVRYDNTGHVRGAGRLTVPKVATTR
jgi:hypothetical protein